MVKALTAATLAKMAQELGTEPLVIVQINWSSGVEYYADKEIAVGAITATGTILEASEISSSGKQDSTGEISSINLVLDDTDGTLKTKVDQIIIEGTTGVVYHHFVGNAQADLTPLLTGKIAGDIQWSEGDRTLTFDLETAIEDGEAGCAPPEGAFPDLQPDAVDKPWPLAFGTVLNVPAVRVKFRPKGSLKNGVNQNFNSFTVTDGADFPQAPTVIQIRIGSVLYTGTMTGEIFSVTTKNDPHNLNVQITNRLSTDPDKSQSTILWIEDPLINLSLQYCFVTHPTAGIMINFCERQVGQKCFFQKPWQSDEGLQQAPQGGAEYLLDNTNIILETSSVPRAFWGAPYIQLNVQHIPAGLTYDAFTLTLTLRIVNGDVWSLNSDLDVLLEVAFNDTYVANCIPGIELLRVSAFRVFHSKRLLMAVPSDYYIVNLSETLGTETAMTLEFPIPLRDRPDEEWEDDIFVSYRSSQGSNVADIIKFLVETFSTMTIDTTSFDVVRSKVVNFPANFAIFDQPNVLSLIESIAFQARCVLFIKNGVVTIIYLSEVPTAVDTLTENNTQLKTIDLSFTTTEDIITKIDATWLSDYSGRDLNSNVFIYRNNVALFGLRAKEINFFIYNIESLVQLSAAFWGFRFSNSWRVIESGTFLKNLEFETLDAVDYTLPILSPNTIIGVLEEVGHDTGTDLLRLKSTLASKAGGGGDPIQDDDYFEGDPAFSIPGATLPPDVGSGIEEGGDLPTAGNDDEDDGPEDATGGESGGQEPLQLVFTAHPSQIIRGVSYSLTVQAQNSAGQIVVLPEIPTITLSLSAGDGSDSLNTSPVALVGGQQTFTGVQITGGAGTDATTIQVTSSLPNWASGTFNFTVIDTQTATLSWDVVPAAVVRDVPFTVTISGGAALDVLDVQLAGSDAGDKLFDASGQITQITLDGGGGFTAADWFISGGVGDDTGNFVLHDPDLIFADTPSTSFTITGVSKQIVAQTIPLTQEAAVQLQFIEILGPASLTDGVPFALTVTLKNSDGSTDTTFNGEFRIEANDLIPNLISWLDVGPEATSYTGFILASATSGVWTYSAVTIDLSTAVSPITFDAEEFQGVAVGTLEVPLAGTPNFIVTLPSSTARATNFTMSVVARIGASVDTGFAADTTLSIGVGDGSDSLSQTTILAAAFTNGIATITTQQITGGSGADSTLIDAVSGAYSGSAIFTVNPTVSTLVVGAKQTYFGQDVFTTPGFTPDEPFNSGEFAQTQLDAQSNYDADTVLGADILNIGGIDDGLTSPGIAARSVNDIFKYIHTRALVEAGYGEFVPAAMVGLLGVYVRGQITLLLRDTPPPFINLVFTPRAEQYTLNIKIVKRNAPDPLTFLSGSALKAMIPDQIVTGAELLQLHKDVSASPSPSPTIDIRLDESIFEGMTETGIRLWMYMTGPVVPYVAPFTDISFFPQAFEAVGFLPTAIVLHKV